MHRFAAIVVVVAYFIVALPLCAYLGLTREMGYIGIVAGMTLGTWLQCGGNGVIVWLTNWESESLIAVQRAQENQTAYLHKEVNNSEDPNANVVSTGLDVLTHECDSALVTLDNDAGEIADHETKDATL